MPGPLDFGVQSYCFRHFKDNATVAQKVRALGLDKIELCAIHADFNQPDAFPEVVATYRDAGVAIVSLGVQLYKGEPHERAWFECAAHAGARHLSAHVQIDTYPRALAQLRQWSREFGIRVGIHCHGGYMFGGQPDVLDHLLALGGPEVGVCIDTAWCSQIGPRSGNAIEWAKRYAGRITGVHYKDFLYEPNGAWRDVIVGQGTLDLPRFVQALEAGGFDGMAVVEYEATPEAPDAPLAECVRAMRASSS